MTGISPWVSVFGTLGAGAVVGALANYALRVWTEKKQKHQERKSLLFLVLLEIFTNETTAKRWKKRLEEDKMRGKSASDEPPTLKIDIWENARTRLAYLVPTEHLYPIIRYYDAVSRWKTTSEKEALVYLQTGLLPRSETAAKRIATKYLRKEMFKDYIRAYEEKFKHLPDTWWQHWYGPGGYLGIPLPRTRLDSNAFGRSNSYVGLSRKESRMKMDAATRQMHDDWRARISSFGVEEELDHDQRLELAKYLWNEYQYRHDLVWKLVFRLTAAVVVLGIIPYTQDKVVNAIHWWILIPPILGGILALVWSLRVNDELGHLDYIRGLYRPLQDSLFYEAHKDKESAFNREIRLFLLAVTLVAALNVGFSYWIVAGKPWFG